MPDSTPIPSHPLPTVNVRRATAEDRPVLERLWLLFRHDLSRFTGDLPRADGTFRSERLEAALTNPGWAAFLATCGASPVGFALVRSLERQPFILNSFFMEVAMRGSGVAPDVAQHVVTTFPGMWEVAFQEANSVATHFWQKVAAAHGPGWTEERRAVPGRPHLPADSWITFEVDDRRASPLEVGLGLDDYVVRAAPETPGAVKRSVLGRTPDPTMKGRHGSRAALLELLEAGRAGAHRLDAGGDGSPR